MTDLVNSPPHYTLGGIEVIDAIEAWALPFHLANVVKYVARAGRKDPDREIEDLEKAEWYLRRRIAQRKADRLAADTRTAEASKRAGQMPEPHTTFDVHDGYALEVLR